MNESHTLALFYELLSLPESAREEWFERRVGDDEALRSRLLGLLDASVERPGGVFDEPLVVPLLDDDRIGAQYGSYRLVESLGVGGMGAVYLAERVDEIEHKAAVKVVRAGTFTTAQLQRFEDERRILATLDHPNIAHFLDSGQTEQGEPYLVLEHVDGLPFLEHCREQRATALQIIALMVDLCSAVEAAHRALLIHADIKPSNVLVRRDGVPKLLDFGIAHLVGASSESSGRALGLTPGYASPEQLRHEPLAVTSDVYSLGALLYHALTGDLPFRFESDSPRSMLNTIETTPLTPPSRSSGALPSADRELDAIVTKALAAEAAHRYPTVGDLLRDLKAYLQGRPVVAFSSSPWYRSTKLITRHKGVSLAAALAISALIASWAATLHQAELAREEAKQSRLQWDRAEAANDFLRSLFEAPNTFGDGAARPEVKVIDVLDRSVDEVRASESLPLADRVLLKATLADLYQNLHRFDVSLELADESQRDLVAGSDLAPGDLSTLLATTQRVGALASMNAGSYDAAIRRYEEVLATLAAAPQSMRRTDAHRLLEAKSRIELAQSLFAVGECDRAMELVAEDLPAATRLANVETSSRRERTLWTAALNITAVCRENAGHTQQAYELMLQARRVHAADSVDDETMSTIEHNLATMSLALGEWSAALEHLEASLAIVRSLGLPEGSDALGYGMAAFANAMLGDVREANRFIDLGEAAQERLPKDHPWRSGTLVWMARALATSGNHREAVERLRMAIEIDRRARPEHQFLPVYCLRLARSLRDLGLNDEAADAYRAAIEGFERRDIGGGREAATRELTELE